MQTKYIIRLEGGLGNQLFQYAHARALQMRYGGELVWDLHAYNSKQIRALSLHHFNIPEIKDTTSLGVWDQLCLKFLQLKHHYQAKKHFESPSCMDQNAYEEMIKKGLYYQYKVPTFPSFFPPEKRINYVSGNYLTAGFFNGAEDLLRKELRVIESLSPQIVDMMSRIQTCNSVCLHVRLGDYLAPEWKDKLYICTPEYYIKAVDLMKQKVESPVFFVFSNRPKGFDWIRENIHRDAEVVYVNMGNTDYQDMALMYNCHHFIMSNSTYSWWAQWLGESKDKVVVAPSRFNNYPRWDMSGIYMDLWNLINI